MRSPKIQTFQEINPLVYSWTTPDIPKYKGWEKIGYTEQATADTRIAQQASQLSVEKKKLWSRRALYTSESGGRFTDRDFHAYLKQHNVEREVSPRRTEWHHFAPAEKTSLDYFNDFAGQGFPSPSTTAGEENYELRPEQQQAVDQALTAFNAGKKRSSGTPNHASAKRDDLRPDAITRRAAGPNCHQSASDRELMVRRLLALHRPPDNLPVCLKLTFAGRTEPDDPGAMARLLAEPS